ncbi:MAG: hypothetical protein QG657_5635 [Acidobacteriota bacterium]|nr:hypothetical protein [Acidobacteriota bacterium]
MNEMLQIIGSIASIVSIPLAIYLFLKSRAQKYIDIRKDIVNRLSFQIGEGRKLTLFEVQSVIESRVRENRIKPYVIRTDEIIEDLVTITINSPMLESARKGEIISSLSELHSFGRLYYLVATDTTIFKQFLAHIKGSKDESDVEIVEKAFERESEQSKKSKTSNAPEVFGFIAGITTLIATMMTLIDFSGALKILPKLLNNEMVTSFVLGIAVSLLAAALTALIKRK